MNLACNCTYPNAKKLNVKLQLTANFIMLYYAYFTYFSFYFRPRSSKFYSVNDLKHHLVNV